MKCNLHCKIGKFEFSCDYTKEDKESAKAAILEYFKFFKMYKDNHSISARTWKFPILYIDNRPFAKITPNGSLDLINNKEGMEK